MSFSTIHSIGSIYRNISGLMIIPGMSSGNQHRFYNCHDDFSAKPFFKVNNVRAI